MSSLAQPAGPGHLDIELALSQIGDTDAMNDMLRLLEESLARDVPHITSLLEQGDTTGANRLLHSLKGFIPIFCADSFCAEVVRVEGMSKDPSDTGLLAAYAGLRPQLEALLAEVSTYLLESGKAA